MMKIVHLIFTLETGGAENLLIDIANEQAANAQVTIILINKKFNAELIGRIDKRIRFYALNREESNRRSLTFLFRLWRLLLSFAPHVIHCHDNTLIRLLPFYRNRTALTVHSMKVPTRHFNKYKKIYSISSAVSSDIERRSGILSPVVINGIDFRNVNYKSSYPAYDNEIRIVQIGRLRHEIKGQDLLLFALSRIFAAGNSHNVSVDFIGSGDSESYLKQTAVRLRVDHSVHFLGERTRKWIYENLHTYDILIHPSRSEGFGLTIIEGIAAGLPVIASNEPALKEILSEMPSGILFRSGDAAHLSQAIMELILKMKERNIRYLCEASRLIANRRYSVRQTAMEYMRHYSTDLQQVAN